LKKRPLLSITGATARNLRTVETKRKTPILTQKYSEKLRNRAQLIFLYAGLNGRSATLTDICDAIAKSEGDGDGYTINQLAAGIKATGMVPEVAQVSELTEDQWPAIVQMTSGQYILVLSQEDETLILYEADAKDQKTRVSRFEFEPYFTGTVVRAEVTLEELSKTHTAKPQSDHWFWGSFVPFKRQFLEVALGSFVANLLAVTVALFSLQVYDRVIPNQSEATLWVLAAGAVIALVLEALLKMARSRLVDGAGRQIEIGIQKLLMDRVLGMRSDLPNRSPSELFSAVREFGSVREFFTSASLGTLTDIPFVCVFLLLVYSIAGNIVFVLIFGGLLMVLPGFFLQKRVIRITREMQGASVKTNRLLHEALVEADTLKTQRAEDRFRRIWNELTTVSAVKSSEQRTLGSILTFWSQGIQQATYLAAVISCTYLIFKGEFTVGSIIAVGILTGRTLVPLSQLAGIMARWGNVKSALDALETIVNAPQDTDVARTYLRRDDTRGGFELRDVIYRYDPDVPPSVNVAAAIIQPGQKVAVLGTNGAGKSTLLKLLSGLYAPQSGTILLDATDMSQIAPKDLRRLIGYLGPDVRLFSGTLRDNLNLNMLEKDDARLFEALDFAGLGQFVRSHARGLDLQLSDGGTGLSSGQRQSIGWARLWLQDPKICLLDEPTAALDQTLEATLISRLETWLKGRTTIMATHRLPIVSLADRTMILQNGRMAIDGPSHEVLAHINQASERKLEATA